MCLVQGDVPWEQDASIESKSFLLVLPRSRTLQATVQVYTCKVCQKSHHTLCTLSHKSTHQDLLIPPPLKKPCLQTLMLCMTGSVMFYSWLAVYWLLPQMAHQLKWEHCWTSASIISEHLANRLSLKRRRQSIHVSGIGGMSHKSPLQSIITFEISSLQPSGKRMKVTAFIVLKVASDLSMEPVLFGLGYLFRWYTSKVLGDWRSTFWSIISVCWGTCSSVSFWN